MQAHADYLEAQRLKREAEERERLRLIELAESEALRLAEEEAARAAAEAEEIRRRREAEAALRRKREEEARRKAEEVRYLIRECACARRPGLPQACHSG